MVDLHNINRTFDQNTKIADLMYGHSGNFILRLRGSFAPENYPSAPKIQICQLKCGCWIIADGNNRLGLLQNVLVRRDIQIENLVQLHRGIRWFYCYHL